MRGAGPRALDFHDKVVVVTGAASGIGRATALAFAAEGARVAACDLEQAGLSATLAACTELGARATYGARVDVGDAAAVADFAARVAVELGPAYCLVNNAGVGVSGGFFDTELSDWSWLLRVNLWGVIHATRAFGLGMRERGEGRIVNVASALGFYNLASMTAYGTTKYAVIGLSEALRQELLPRGVKVSVVCPGLVDTPIIETARLRGVADEQRERASLRELYRRRGSSPESIAKVIVNAARGGRAFVPVTPEAWLLYAMKRLAPSALPALLHRSARFYKR